jgi:hypothetical protein
MSTTASTTKSSCKTNWLVIIIGIIVVVGAIIALINCVSNTSTVGNSPSTSGNIQSSSGEPFTKNSNVASKNNKAMTVSVPDETTPLGYTGDGVYDSNFWISTCNIDGQKSCYINAGDFDAGSGDYIFYNCMNGSCSAITNTGDQIMMSKKYYVYYIDPSTGIKKYLNHLLSPDNTCDTSADDSGNCNGSNTAYHLQVSDKPSVWQIDIPSNANGNPILTRNYNKFRLKPSYITSGSNEDDMLNPVEDTSYMMGYFDYNTTVTKLPIYMWHRLRRTWGVPDANDPIVFEIYDQKDCEIPTVNKFFKFKHVNANGQTGYLSADGGYFNEKRNNGVLECSYDLSVGLNIKRNEPYTQSELDNLTNWAFENVDYSNIPTMANEKMSCTVQTGGTTGGETGTTGGETGTTGGETGGHTGTIGGETGGQTGTTGGQTGTTGGQTGTTGGETDTSDGPNICSVVDPRTANAYNEYTSFVKIQSTANQPNKLNVYYTCPENTICTVVTTTCYVSRGTRYYLKTDDGKFMYGNPCVFGYESVMTYYVSPSNSIKFEFDYTGTFSLQYGQNVRMRTQCTEDTPSKTIFNKMFSIVPANLEENYLMTPVNINSPVKIIQSCQNLYLTYDRVRQSGELQQYLSFETVLPSNYSGTKSQVWFIQKDPTCPSQD